jgi:hypothetical protein
VLEPLAMALFCTYPSTLRRALLSVLPFVQPRGSRKQPEMPLHTVRLTVKKSAAIFTATDKVMAAEAEIPLSLAEARHAGTVLLRPAVLKDVAKHLRGKYGLVTVTVNTADAFVLETINGRTTWPDARFEGRDYPNLSPAWTPARGGADAKVVPWRAAALFTAAARVSDSSARVRATAMGQPILVTAESLHDGLSWRGVTAQALE